MRKCDECGRAMPSTRRSDARYCSDQCRRAHDNRASRARSKQRIRERLGTVVCRNPYCGSEFVPLKGKQYCSKGCLYLGQESRKYGKGAEESAAIYLHQLMACRVWFFSCVDCGSVFVHRRKSCGRTPLCKGCSRRRYLEHNARKNHKRRAPGLPVLSVYQLAERDGCRCNICGRKVDLKLSGRAKYGPTIDHLIPISQGGTNAADNLALAHRACNVARGNRVPAQLLLTV